MNQPNYLEIEHKFVVDEDFDQDAFIDKVMSLKPHKTTTVNVKDTYFLLQSVNDFVYRYRFDEELSELTVKELCSDNEVRLEVNLGLNRAIGTQEKEILEFFKPVGVRWSGYIEKKVSVFKFPKCEVVFYRASSRVGSINCVEFEALNCESLDEALTVIERHEKLLGFANRERERKSLFNMLLKPSMPNTGT